MGGILFTKYLMKQGKALHRILEKHPTRAIFLELMQVITGVDIPPPLDTFTSLEGSGLSARMPYTDPVGVGVHIATPNIFDFLSV
jgi:hypothetical protein